jgi:hypothetical protein
MLRWFGYVERLDERRLTKEIYEAYIIYEATVLKWKEVIFVYPKEKRA